MRALFVLPLFWLSCGFHLVLTEPAMDQPRLCGEGSCAPSPINPRSSALKLTLPITKAPYGTLVASRWFYLDPQRGPLKIRDRVTDLNGPRQLTHSLKVPRVGYFKAGTYEVVVELAGRRAGQLRFQVASLPTKPAPPHPSQKESEEDLLDDGL